MTTSHLIVLVALFLVLQPITASPNSTTINSFLDKLCEEVECGKGTCKASLDYTYNFICECESGWKQTRDGEVSDGRGFQPCIYPNCTMDYSCGEAPPPTAYTEERPKNISFYDPCYWSYCGDGSCSPTSGHGYKCECEQGYTNLMNITSFPCFSQCVIGSDCSSLGVTLSNETTGTTTGSENYASSIVPRSFLWLIVLVLSLAMVPRF